MICFFLNDKICFVYSFCCTGFRSVIYYSDKPGELWINVLVSSSFRDTYYMQLKSSVPATGCCTASLSLLQYHIVETHIVQYLDKRGDGTKGLGYWSEQAMESCHHDFKEFWSHTKVDQDHPNFAERLLSTIIKYNISHIQIIL